MPRAGGRSEVLALSRTITKNPSATASPMFEVRVAAALPLLFEPVSRSPRSTAARGARRSAASDAAEVRADQAVAGSAGRPTCPTS
jgi:hypothetical protein